MEKNNMKLAIVTRADKNVESLASISHPLFKKYAKKCGADFFVLSEDEKEYFGLNNYRYWRILQINNLFNKGYDRVLHLDTDIVITDNAPNIFDVVPEATIGAVFEDKGSLLADRRLEIQKIQTELGDINWTKGYINEGVILLSKQHKAILDRVDGKLCNSTFASSQGHINYQIKNNNFNIINLGYKYNHMSLFSEPWNENKNRFESYFIHYAGGGKFKDKGNMSLESLMAKDKQLIYKTL